MRRNIADTGKGLPLPGLFGLRHVNDDAFRQSAPASRAHTLGVWS
ncbi:MAG: hypothetical protein V5B33_16365 [Candidatus Accumulibacter sp. UW20]